MKKSVTKKRVAISDTLNEPQFHSTAAIHVDIKREESYRKDKKEYIDGDITISDCSRSITLDLDAHDKRELRNTKKKLDIMIKALTTAREWLEQQDPRDMNWHLKTKDKD